jgi:ribosome production factor 2
LKIRKIQLALDDMYKKALIQPKELKLKRQKNVETDAFSKRVRVHVGRQNVNVMALKKYKVKNGF